MDNEFFKNIQELEDLLEEAYRLPLSKNKCVVDSGKFFDIIDRIKETLPDEMSRSREVLENKDIMLHKAKEDSNVMLERAKKAAEQMLVKAKKSSDAILARAKEQAAHMTDEQKIMVVAKERAAEIIERAKNDAMRMRNVTISYVDDVIASSEKALGAALNNIQSVKGKYDK